MLDASGGVGVLGHWLRCWGAGAGVLAEVLVGAGVWWGVLAGVLGCWGLGCLALGVCWVLGCYVLTGVLRVLGYWCWGAGVLGTGGVAGRGQWGPGRLTPRPAPRSERGSGGQRFAGAPEELHGGLLPGLAGPLPALGGGRVHSLLLTSQPGLGQAPAAHRWASAAGHSLCHFAWGPCQEAEGRRKTPGEGRNPFPLFAGGASISQPWAGEGGAELPSLSRGCGAELPAPSPRGSPRVRQASEASPPPAARCIARPPSSL